MTEDPDRAYREKSARAYALRRGLGLLVSNGLGVFLVPSGMITGRTIALLWLHEKLLKRHHRSSACRLPSATFAGAMLNADRLFLRALRGEPAEVDGAERFGLDGAYFTQFQSRLLCTEVGTDAGDDDGTTKPRWGL